VPGNRNPWPTTCPRCGHESGLTLVADAPGKWHERFLWPDPKGETGTTVGQAWEQAGLYQCPTCEGFTLRTILTAQQDGSGKMQAKERLPLGVPKPKEGLPVEVGADRDDAWRAFHGTLFKGSALLARSSLEAAVKKLGATGQDLKAKIKNLADKGEITQVLADWATEVRITRNEARTKWDPFPRTTRRTASPS
jgi:Domain of unknown function (DUF4145)